MKRESSATDVKAGIVYCLAARQHLSLTDSGCRRDQVDCGHVVNGGGTRPVAWRQFGAANEQEVSRAERAGTKEIALQGNPASVTAVDVEDWVNSVRQQVRGYCDGRHVRHRVPTIRGLNGVAHFGECLCLRQQLIRTQSWRQLKLTG